MIFCKNLEYRHPSVNRIGSERSHAEATVHWLDEYSAALKLDKRVFFTVRLIMLNSSLHFYSNEVIM
jgi:hypothetical protein